MDALGDRMKDYERRETGQKFMPLLPIYARIDGRGFSRFTQGLSRPYDSRFRDAMRHTTMALVDATDAKIGYTQSDEISLCWHSERPESDVFFAGKKQKMVSQLAALATAHFFRFVSTHTDPEFAAFADRMPTFDARVFQLPTRAECVNALLWREQDATKNALSMAARSVYSHRDMMNKNGPDLHEMLFAKGINFNDYPAEFKRGVFVRRQSVSRLLTDDEWNRIPTAHRPERDLPVTRTLITPIDMPPFGQVINRVGVVFEGEQPQVASLEATSEQAGPVPGSPRAPKP